MTTLLQELVYNPKSGCDEYHNTPIAYKGSDYATAEEAAKGLYEVLKKQAVAMGMAETEVSLFDPERTEGYSGQREWCVVWEAGPHDWAISMSMQIRGPWGHCEPYYGFDLHFTN